MLQYLLNLSAIWLLSLIVFDAFLRRDTYHTYNRLYLMLTLVMGVMLPLFSWQADSVFYSNTISRPVLENVTVIKKTVVESAPGQTAFDWQQYIWVVYGIGVVVGLILLLKDVTLIIRLYSKGDKTKDGVWTIIETGKEHTPFSAFRYVFISNKKNYSEEELRMILSHEEQHGHLLHFIDLIFIQITKTAFWFHPLVYLYYNRLITVHEYQADAAVDKAPATYGKFLVEQAILQSAPALTHSFNRSPIKKRILMLTRKTSAIAKSKQLVSLPLILLCILCFTKNAFSDDKRIKNGNKVTYKGNVFEIKVWAPDTGVVVEPTTGKEFMRITERDPSPITMNGKHIYSDYKTEDGFSVPTDGINSIGVLSSSALKQFLINNLKEEIKQLSDGQYNINLTNIVLDEKGRIAYYDFAGVSKAQSKRPDYINAYSKSALELINTKIVSLLNKVPSKTPATINGKPVPYMINNRELYQPFSVVDKVATFY